MKKLTVAIAMIMLFCWQASGQITGCLNGNDLYTLKMPGGKYGDNASSGPKVTAAADQCFYTSNPSPTPCIICVYGINPAGNCRTGLVPVAYTGFEASYVVINCTLDAYISILFLIISGAGFLHIRNRMAPVACVSPS